MIQALTSRLIDFTAKSPDENLPQAAVLILCYEKDDDLFFIMTKRSNSLPSHPGEVAFPGWKKEENDKDLKQTALREASEEISIDSSNFEILGLLEVAAEHGSNAFGRETDVKIKIVCVVSKA